MTGGALPVMSVLVDGRECSALIDTGCTDTLVHVRCCRQWRSRRISVTTMSGDQFCCAGVGSVDVRTSTGQQAQLEVLVVDERPMGVDLILGMSGITALGGISVRGPSDVHFCGAASRAASHQPPAVDTADFTARFDADRREWTVAWKWANGAGPDCLTNGVAQYAVAPSARDEFDREIDAWITNGWLLPYDEQADGPPRGLVPLMAVRQNNQAKVRPVLDYRELNGFVTAHTADADVCADQLRRWRRHGTRIAVVDLRKAYLQLRLERRLWPFQTVIVRGQRYCLTRLGFGLNVAPLIMKAVIRAVLSQDPDMERAVLPYVDDLLVDEAIVSADCVVEHFAKFGLVCKPPQRAVDGARMLGLRVQREAGELRWARDNGIAAPPSRVTRRAVFAWCGQLAAHLPVCGWLRPATAWLKRRANAVTRGWDDDADDAALSSQIAQVAGRLSEADPARGPWCFSGDRVIIWADASSIASGVVVETPDDGIVEDACWLRSDDSAALHINMAELDAAVRGINMAIAWGVRIIDLRTDSATVHKWVDDALSGRARLRTKAQAEMLIRRRVDIIRQLVDELQLTLTVTLVRSAENRADALTRVPKEWLRGGSADVGAPADRVVREETADARAPAECAASGKSARSVVESRETGDKRADTRGLVAGAAARDEHDSTSATRDGSDTAAAIAEVHAQAGHPGIRRTLYFVRRDVSRSISRSEAQNVVRRCDVCCSIDPAPARWDHGSLDVAGTWERLAIDITHYEGRSYLTLIDCGPSRFSLWRLLRRPDADTVVGHLEDMFRERGAPLELLGDNDTVFRSRRFAAFAAKWGTELRFRAVYEPGGNGIVERSHRTIKVIAARKRCSISEALHLYNVTPRDGNADASAPAGAVYRYPVRDCVRPAADQPVPRRAAAEPDIAAPGAAVAYAVGDHVWVRRRGVRCTESSRRGVVTGTVSPQVVEVDGMPWHVRCLRRRHDGVAVDSGFGSRAAGRDDDAPPLFVQVELCSHVDAAEEEDDECDVMSDEPSVHGPPQRRSGRDRRPPQRLICGE